MERSYMVISHTWISQNWKVWKLNTLKDIKLSWENLLINNCYFKSWAVQKLWLDSSYSIGGSPTGNKFQGYSQLCSPCICKWSVEVCSSLLMQWISLSEVANIQLLKRHSEKSNLRLTSKTCRKLSWWSNKWQKRFNVNKCKVMHMAILWS